MSPIEMSTTGNWDVVLGDPANYVLPLDPLMIESVNTRSGTNPITGDALAPAGSGLLANPINGHEVTIAQRDDLQYACIFPLAVPRDCSAPMQTACDCLDPINDNPLCQDPSGAFGTTQYYAKAYPGLRHLSVLKALGERGVVGSICPPQLTNAIGIDFGYRAAFDALADAASRSFAK